MIHLKLQMGKHDEKNTILCEKQNYSQKCTSSVSTLGGPSSPSPAMAATFASS